MEMKVVQEKENPLFSRKELVLEIKSNSVPKREDVLKEVSKKFSAGEDLIRIQSIKGKFGVQIFSAIVDVYSSKKEFERVVKKTKKETEKEKKEAEEKRKAEAEAKKAKEEESKKTEEPKEELKEEKDEEKKEEAKENKKEEKSE